MNSEPRSEFPIRPLPEEVLSALSPIMQEARYERGDVIIARGKPGRGLFFVRSGSAEAIIRGEDGLGVPLGRFGPGSYFGEMALLTGQVTSADVVAAEDCTIGIVTRPEFERLLAASSLLGRHFATTLADRLDEANRSLLDVHQRRSALSDFLRHDERVGPPAFGARRTRKLLDLAEETARNPRAVLVLGEAGVGKRTIARLIHQRGPAPDGPLISVECSHLDEEAAVRLLFGSSEPEAVSHYAARLGYLHLAEGGTLVLAQVDALPVEAQKALATFLRAAETPNPCERTVALKVVAMARRTPAELAAPGGMDPALLACFGDQLLEVPPLRSRKADIVPLTTSFLERYAQTMREAPKQLSPDAQRKLLSYDFRFGNVSELQEAVERAARLCDGNTILEEHVFLGATGGDEVGQIDLLRLPAVQNASKRRFFMPLVQAACGMVFAAIIVACLGFPRTATAKWANMAVWCIWWPLLVLSFFPVGRLWCGICPLSWWGNALRRVKRLDIAPPSWLKRWSGSTLMVGFLLIIWTEQAATMPEHPFATGILLVSLIVACALAAILFQRHTWCRYLCPLGAIGATFATCAVMRLRANRAVCATQCTGHECFRGSAEVEGCPMFHHALFVEDGPNCKFCMNCLQACPNGSIRVFVQAPLRDLWRPELGTGELASFGVVLGGGALALMLSRSSFPELAWLRTAVGFGVACGIVLAIGLAMRAATEMLEARERHDASSLMSRLGYALVPLFWGALFAYHIGSNAWLAHYTLSLSAPSARLASAPVLPLAQALVMVLGALLSLYGLWRVCRTFCASSGLMARGAWLTTTVLALAYTAAALAASA